MANSISHLKKNTAEPCEIHDLKNSRKCTGSMRSSKRMPKPLVETNLKVNFFFCSKLNKVKIFIS